MVIAVVIDVVIGVVIGAADAVVELAAIIVTKFVFFPVTVILVNFACHAIFGR